MDITNDSSYNCFSPSLCRAASISAEYQRHLFFFETFFDECHFFEFGIQNWKICFYFIGIYLLAIFVGPRIMKSRPPYQLRGALLWWNAFMAVFSIFCAWRTVSAQYYQIKLGGFYPTLCVPGFTKQYQQSLSLYSGFFALSKVLELGDTAFIVLRKTPLIFLHWFHHATVVFFVWACFAYPSPIHSYFMSMNYSVHSFMYSYYVLKVLKIRVPMPVNIAITSLQLLQMMGGLFVTLYTNYMRATSDAGCCVIDTANKIALAIYFAYFVLFTNFFFWTYVVKKKRAKKD